MKDRKEEILSLIKMIHFDNQESGDLQKDWNKWKESNSSIEFPTILDHNIFMNRLSQYFTKEVISEFNLLADEDSDFFKEFINLFDLIKEKSNISDRDDFNKIFNDLNIGKTLSEIEDAGISKCEGLFTDDELSTLCNFQDQVFEGLKGEIEHSGYISMNQISENKFQIRHDKTLKNHGLSRLQSKSMGFFHPGSDVLIKNDYLRAVFKSYYRNLDTEFHRATLEWLNPSPYNHNGWHYDLLRNQLKVQILLDDVTIDNGPMFYAIGSHRISNSLERDIKHSMFKNGISKKFCLFGKMWKNHEATVNECHSGYLSDDIVDNVPETMTSDPIQISDFTYDKFICTGKKGDCVFFESSGLHSGNIARSGMRKDIVLTCPDRLPFKNKFLEFINKKDC